jgi:hypothetical protein
VGGEIESILVAKKFFPTRPILPVRGHGSGFQVSPAKTSSARWRMSLLSDTKLKMAERPPRGGLTAIFKFVPEGRLGQE